MCFAEGTLVEAEADTKSRQTFYLTMILASSAELFAQCISSLYLSLFLHFLLLLLLSSYAIGKILGRGSLLLQLSLSPNPLLHSGLGKGEAK